MDITEAHEDEQDQHMILQENEVHSSGKMRCRRRLLSDKRNQPWKVALVPSDCNWALKKEEKAQQQAERSQAYDEEKVRRQEKKELCNAKWNHHLKEWEVQNTEQRTNVSKSSRSCQRLLKSLVMVVLALVAFVWPFWMAWIFAARKSKDCGICTKHKHQSQWSVGPSPTIALLNSWGEFQHASLGEEEKEEKADDEYDEVADEDSYVLMVMMTIMRMNSSMMVETVRMMHLFQ